MNIHTEVTLRAIEPEDLDVLYGIENNSETWGIGCTNVPYSRYVLHEYIANASADIYADRQVRLVIETHEHEVAGIVDVVNFDPQNRRAEIGIVIKKAFRRKGYATAALGEVARYAKTTLHIHQLYTYIDMLNEPSLSLFRKQGYTVETVMKDWLYDGSRYRDALLMQVFLT